MPSVREPSDVQEEPYQGRAGTTRIDQVHVQLADGTLRTMTIYRGVNVGTDPHLREVVLSGELHHLEPSVELAIPFVYHDPAVRKMALVVPEALRHEELRERARLLQMIADETTVPVPRYAAEATTVIGIRGLREYLERGSERDQVLPPQLEAELETQRRELRAREEAVAQREQRAVEREQALRAREEAVAQREQELAARERRMRERAEHLTRREDELAGLAEEHQAAQRDLARREQALEQRLELLVRREQALADRERGLSDRERELAEPSLPAERRDPGAERPRTIPAPKPLSSRPPPLPASPIARALSDSLEVDSSVSEVRDDEVEEIDELEPIRTHPRIELEEGVARRRAAAERMDVLAEDVEEIADDEVEEEVDEADVSPHVGEEPRTVVASAPDVSLLSTEGGPPRPAELSGWVEMVARATDGVDLYVSLGHRVDAFERGADLLIQLVANDGVPVVILALVDASDSEHFVRRAGLDPRSPADRRVIEALRRRFEARTAFYDENGRFVRAGWVSAPRELNAARILDRIARLPSDPRIDTAAAIERALAAPPPITGDHPFLADGQASRLDTAAGVAVAVAELAQWMSPEKMDEALLVFSVPRDTIETTITRILERAIEDGLALPSGLIDRALSAGFVPDVATLVARQIQAFRATVAKPDAGGLDDAAIATNWERLLALAADHEVAIDSDIHDMAWRAIRAVRGEQADPSADGSIDPSRFAEMSTSELVMLLDHPRYRRAAAFALCERGDPRLAEPLCKAVRKMPRADVVRIVPRITRLGDEAGDALIDGLSARKTFVRQAFALALGHIRLRRAVVPLLHLLSSEPSDIWREIARISATFGNAAFRTLSQRLADAKAPEERYVLTLAHLANHGCEKQVEVLTGDPDPRVASLARRALHSRDEAQRQSDIVTGKRPADDSDPVVAFSRRFIEELEGRAPETDFAVVPDEEP